MSERSYIGIPRDLIAADAVTGVDLYVLINGRYVLYRSGTKPVDEHALQKLRRRDVETVYVRTEQVEDFNQYVIEHLEVALERAPSAAARVKLLRRAVETVLQGSLSRLDDPETYQRTKQLSDVTVRSIADDSSVLAGLVRFGEGDERLLARSLNVAAYAIALAQRQPQFTREDLYSIGIGALIRDAGLARATESLTPEDEELTDMERSYLDRHAHRAASMLKDAGVSDQIVFDIVSGHHDWPYNREIPLHTRIVQLADRFDAMTNVPGAEQATGPFAALAEMRRRASDQFSPDLIRDFVMLLSTATTSADHTGPATPLSRRRQPDVAAVDQAANGPTAVEPAAAGRVEVEEGTASQRLGVASA